MISQLECKRTQHEHAFDFARVGVSTLSRVISVCRVPLIRGRILRQLHAT